MQVAMRELLTSTWRPTMPTAADYVQDGLIGMWDGIENAGWGVHNESATQWVDLVRPNLQLKISAGSWTSTAMVTSTDRGVGGTYGGGFYFNGLSTNTYADKTIEAVFEIPSVKNAGGSVITWQSSQAGPLTLSTAWSYLRFTGGGNGNYGNDNNSLSIASFVGQRWKGSLSTDPVNKQLYHNGEVVRNNFTFMGAADTRYQFVIGCMRQANVNWHSVRVYSRVLTAAEIAANHRIDRSRFKVP